MIDPDYQEDIGLALHKGGKKDCVWSAGNPLGHLLPLPCPVNKVNGKLQQPHPGRMKKDDRGRTFRMRVWVPLQVKSHGLLRCLLRVEEILNEYQRKVVVITSQSHMASHGNEDYS